MKFLAPIRCLLALLAVIGLILAPIAAPTMAIAADMHAAMDAHAAMTMPGDMPCCPDQAPTPNCGKDCPFMAMCAAQAFCNAPQSEAPVVFRVLASVIVPGNDADVRSLSHGPPPRPPKI